MNLALKTLLQIFLIKGVGPATTFKILNLIYKKDLSCKDQGGCKSLLDLSTDIKIEDFDVEILLTIDPSIIQNLLKTSQELTNEIITKLKTLEDVEKELKLVEQYKINLISIFDETYPKKLKNIHLPPAFLYTKGAPLTNNKKLAVVGARKSGNYAQDVCDYFVKELVNYDWEIVSGGAAGVDTMAHKATLENNGKTIAIFGCGLLTTYPSENKNLFREIVEKNGTIVSCFPLQEKPMKENFPARNRIIAGLSDGCLLVEAAEKSGAKITAKLALDQGKSVFAIPGSIFSELSVGCHQVIAEGAKIVFTPEDILEDFGIETKKEKPPTVATKKAPKTNITTLKKQSFLDPRLPTSPRLRRTGRGDDMLGNGSNNLSQENENNNFSKEVNLILENLKHSSSIDELSSLTGMDLPTLQNELFDLQLEGIVKQNFAGYWEQTK